MVIVGTGTINGNLFATVFQLRGSVLECASVLAL